MSQAYRLRPSSFYGIVDELKAWSFDRAVWLFGSSLEAELEEAAHSAKNSSQAESRQRQVMEKWLGGAAPRKFRNPSSGPNGGVSSNASGAVTL